MKIDLKARYQTMDEVVDDLEAYAGPAGDAAGAGRRADAPTVEPAPPTPTTTASATGSRRRRRRSATRRPRSRRSTPKNVLCVEAQDEIQEAFRKALDEDGLPGPPGRRRRARGRAYRETHPDAVIFDADGLGPEALDTFLDMHEKAHEDGHDLTALVLLGPSQQDLSKKLPTDDRLVVLTKPVKMKDVQEALAQLVPVG